MAGAAADNTAAIVFGGYEPPPADTNSTKTESWNGTNWTEVNDLNSSRERLAGIGTSTSALAFGGSRGPAGPTAFTEEWNGTNWTEVADLSNARSQMPQGSGNVSNGLGYGGQTPSSFLNSTEEWTAKNPTTVTFSDSE